MLAGQEEPASSPQEAGENGRPKRRRYTKDFKEEMVQMLLDGHSASSIAQRLGLSGPNLIYRGKSEVIGR